MLDDKEIISKFASNVKKIREAKGLTLIDLEVATGIDESYLSKIELGKKNISIVILTKLATGLGVTPCAFFDCK
jgi:transcriptional regulator with XRE-family HTH domain